MESLIVEMWWIVAIVVVLVGIALLGLLGRRENGEWHADRRRDERRDDERREGADRRSSARLKHDEIHNSDRRLSERREDERRSQRDWQKELDRVKDKVESVQHDNRNA